MRVFFLSMDDSVISENGMVVLSSAEWSKISSGWILRVYKHLLNGSQRTHGAITTSLWCQNDVATSFWRHNGVIIAWCVRWTLAGGLLVPGRWRWCPPGGCWGQRGRTPGANSPCELYPRIFFDRESKHVCGNNSSMRTWTLAGKLKIARERWPSYSRLLAIRVCKVTIWNEQQH